MWDVHMHLPKWMIADKGHLLGYDTISGSYGRLKSLGDSTLAIKWKYLPWPNL